VSRFLLFSAAWTVTAPYDTDVAPSGTAGPEQAEKAGVPKEFADNDPDDPALLQKDGAPTPLVAVLQGEQPAQDPPEGRPGEQGKPVQSAGSPEPARTATGGDQAVGEPYPDAPAQPTAASEGGADAGGGKAAAIGAGAVVGAAGMALLGRRKKPPRDDT